MNVEDIIVVEKEELKNSSQIETETLDCESEDPGEFMTKNINV